MTEYIVEVDDKVAEVFVKRFDWETVTLFGHHLVGEIVRCRDCVWAKPDQSDHEFRELRCNMWIADVSADGFCSRGKREQ